MVSQAVPDTHPIDAPGTPEAEWTAWDWHQERAFASTLVSGASASSVVIVAAHPDDEVLGAGGLISVLAAGGARLRLVAVTDGEASHRGRARPSTLVRRRAAETAAALDVLGAETTEVIRLGLPDGQLAAREESLVADLRRLTAGFGTCLAPWDRDMHPDHEATGRAASRACPQAVCYYPIWMWHWACPGDPRVPWDRAARVRLPAWAAARKQAAIGCFASQLEDRGGGLGPVLAPEMIAHFTRAAEVLIQ